MENFIHEPAPAIRIVLSVLFAIHLAIIVRTYAVKRNIEASEELSRATGQEPFPRLALREFKKTLAVFLFFFSLAWLPFVFLMVS